jgi:hypothetical protein
VGEFRSGLLLHKAPASRSHPLGVINARIARNANPVGR